MGEVLWGRGTLYEQSAHQYILKTVNIFPPSQAFCHWLCSQGLPYASMLPLVHNIEWVSYKEDESIDLNAVMWKLCEIEKSRFLHTPNLVPTNESVYQLSAKSRRIVVQDSPGHCGESNENFGKSSCSFYQNLLEYCLDMFLIGRAYHQNECKGCFIALHSGCYMADSGCSIADSGCYIADTIQCMLYHRQYIATSSWVLAIAFLIWLVTVTAIHHRLYIIQQLAGSWSLLPKFSSFYRHWRKVSGATILMKVKGRLEVTTGQMLLT